MTVRSTPANKHMPYYFADDVSSNFLESVFKVTAQEFAYKYENYALLGVSSLASNSNAKKIALKGSIREAVNSGLRMLPKLLSPIE